MELENVLLGLIRLRPGVTGYELNDIIQESTGYLMSASLGHIYPSLRKLHERGWVTFTDQPIKNRPSKKFYTVTPAGEQALNAWLRAPAAESDIDFRPFLLKMSFSPLMPRDTILDHIDREIARYERMLREKNRGNRVEMDYLDQSSIDPARAEFLWKSIYQVGLDTSHLRLAWLKEWRQSVAQCLGR